MPFCEQSSYQIPSFTNNSNPKRVLPFDVAPVAPGVACGVVDGCFWPNASIKAVTGI